MFYDFNIPFPDAPEKDDITRLERILTRIQSIEKGIIAWNKTTTNPLKNFERVAPLSPSRFPDIKQMSRLTVVVDDMKKNYQLTISNGANAQVDILAVRPTNVDVCKHACMTYDVDILSIDCSVGRNLPNFAAAQVAVERGVFFEICYAQAVRVPHLRSVFFANVNRLVTVTRGKNLLFSSEAMHALEIRRPSDIRVLARLFGMTEDQAEEAVDLNMKRLLLKAETRRATVLSAISATPIHTAAVEKRKLPANEDSSKKVKL